LATDATNSSLAVYLRPSGFATAPFFVAAITLFLLARLLPILREYLFYGSFLWWLLGQTVAARQTFSYGEAWGRALGVEMIGVVVMVVVRVFLFEVFLPL
jgi:hypothetical protein